MEGRRPPRASSMMIARNYARPTPIVSLPLPFRKQGIHLTAVRIFYVSGIRLNSRLMPHVILMIWNRICCKLEVNILHQFVKCYMKYF